MPSANDIRAAVQVRRTKEREGRQPVTGTLKSKRSRRTVPLPGWLTAHLADYLADTRPHGDTPTAPLWPSRKYGGGRRGRRPAVSGAFGLVAAVGNGHLLRHDHEACLEAIGLPASRPARTADDGTAIPANRGVRLHDLRHTFAVLQLSAGVHFMQVSKWLGHSSFTLTLDVYGDYVPEQDGGALNTLPEPPAAAKWSGTEFR